MDDSTIIERPCTIPNEKRIIISWDGDVSICNLDVNMALTVSNILDVPDFEKIRKSNNFKKVYDTIKKREGICANCHDGGNKLIKKFTRNDAI